MTTSELIKRLNSLDFVGSVEYDKDTVYIYSEKGRISCIKRKTVGHVDMSYSSFLILEDCERRQLFILCAEYALTPLDQREEAKKYKLLFKVGRKACLKTTRDDILEPYRFWIDSLPNMLGAQNKFTQAEIDKIKEKYGEDCLDSFEQVEVES